MVVTSEGELGFDFEEGVWETTTTSKKGSKRTNYPILSESSKNYFKEIYYLLDLSYYLSRTSDHPFISMSTYEKWKI